MKNFFKLFMVLIFAFSTFLSAEIITLQNGTNYSGCEDTYVSDDDWQNDNFGGSNILSLQGYH